MKKIKETILEIILCGIFLGFIFGMCTVAELLSRVITMDVIMTVVYIALGYSFIYIFKNL